ncbi:MAG: TlpA family protein disulfide reductase [Acidobacteria bacterium]|nr:TlpA family protein disulfide reductase [Acidobacteriota bacterium]MBI3422792.1 TlpA family protein disulfide reductase [Acidobacteriota bacterium]
MAATTLHQLFSSARALGALMASLLLALMVSAAPRLGADDIPELPLADGSGDTPEMILKLVPPNAGPVVGAQKAIKLSSLRGKVTLLDMFWSKCPHCEEHAPHVTEWNTAYSKRGLNILGLATDQETDLASVRSFMAKAKTPYPVAFITNMVVAYYADSHDHGVPQMILFGADGKMVKRTIGWNEKLGEEMKQAIEEELKKVAPAPATVKPGSKATAKPVAQKTKQG